MVRGFAGVAPEHQSGSNFAGDLGQFFSGGDTDSGCAVVGVLNQWNCFCEKKSSKSGANDRIALSYWIGINISVRFLSSGTSCGLSS
jgi:hypothetical protein